MARSTFGGTASDFVTTASSGGLLRLASAVLTFWDAPVGGNRHADLLLDGTATSAIQVGSNGQIPAFEGPDGVTSLWVDDGDNQRARLVAEGKSGPVGPKGDTGAPGGSDPSFAGWINDPASQTRGALDATYETRTQARAREDRIIATDFGMVGDGTTINDTTALNDALGTENRLNVYWPPGDYRLGNDARYGSSLRPVSYVRHYGPAFGNFNLGTGNPSTKIRPAGSPLLAPTGVLYGLEFADLCLAIPAGGVTMIDLGVAGTRSGGLAFSRFDRCWLNNNEPAASFLFQGSVGANNNFFDVEWNGCRMERPATSTKPMFDITSGAGTSHLRFIGGWWHSHGCTSTPFFKASVADNSASFVGAFEFAGVIGEQNGGGMIHCYSCTDVRIDQVVDFDQHEPAVGNQYADNLFYFASATGSQAPRNIAVKRSGTDGPVPFAADKYIVRIIGGTGHDVGPLRYGNSRPPVKVPASGRVVRQDGGFARNFRTVSAAATITDSDDVVMCNPAAAITVTLPTVASVQIGRAFTIKNQSAQTITVAPQSGSLIDGAANTQLTTQWSKVTVVTDGASWFTV